MEIFALIIAILLSIVIVVIGLILIGLNINLYFLTFKLEKHPVLIQIVDDAINRICKKENLPMFHETYEKLNVNRPESKDKALGMYVYTLDKNFQEKVQMALNDMEQLENQYKMSYKEICKLAGKETILDKQDFIFSRILLCYDELIAYGGLKSYYSTYFHEIGHHFALKEIGGEHTEEDANIQGRKLILENLPFFFQLFPYFRYKYRLDLPKLSWKELIRAHLDYFKYHIHNRKTIIKTKKNEKGNC